METAILHCPQCHGRLLAADAPIGDLPERRLAGEDYYCPSCEMFIEPDRSLETSEESLATIDPGVTPEDRGRWRAAGWNAGGSQRGDLSDQGATQWRRDPEEIERNTWKGKD
ncbi:MAG TPA: hypothetical protein VMB47_11300 [Candidatus Aquilonibacter sp.]|nr:hypothetical protein [Candidatus Aquilonibacter sp.]